mmetsp:Transcript_41434/g.118267  ORF Transcript_41434/g.118267 Transcript_41434/m.118267 type:complete len:264 (+) Transcript_41434:290-1081(+)
MQHPGHLRPQIRRVAVVPRARATAGALRGGPRRRDHVECSRVGPVAELAGLARAQEVVPAGRLCLLCPSVGRTAVWAARPIAPAGIRAARFRMVHGASLARLRRGFVQKRHEALDVAVRRGEHTLEFDGLQADVALWRLVRPARDRYWRPVGRALRQRRLAHRPLQTAVPDAACAAAPHVEDRVVVACVRLLLPGAADLARDQRAGGLVQAQAQDRRRADRSPRAHAHHAAIPELVFKLPERCLDELPEVHDILDHGLVAAAQ